MSGGRDQWSAPLLETPRDPVPAVWRLLREVLDPELPISVVDLGLVYALSFEEQTVAIDLTFTATACPCMDFIKEDIEDRLMREDWIHEVRFVVVWDPPWTTARISTEGKAKLRELGVGA